MNDEAKPKKVSPLKGRRRLIYDEGDWFAVPIGKDAYCLGLIVRKSQGYFVGYYFPKLYHSLPTEEDVQGWKPEDAIEIGHTHHSAVYCGDWPLIGRQRSFNRDSWPHRFFWIQDPLVPERCFLREYWPEDGSSSDRPRETWHAIKDVLHLIVDLPYDSYSPPTAIQIGLERYFKTQNGEAPK